VLSHCFPLTQERFRPIVATDEVVDQLNHLSCSPEHVRRFPKFVDDFRRESVPDPLAESVESLVVIRQNQSVNPDGDIFKAILGIAEISSTHNSSCAASNLPRLLLIRHTLRIASEPLLNNHRATKGEAVRVISVVVIL